jgi:hypothetical protein
VTGALYVPNRVKKNAPAVFYVCGHSLDGFRATTYQHIIINLVKKVLLSSPLILWDKGKDMSIGITKQVNPDIPFQIMSILTRVLNA